MEVKILEKMFGLAVFVACAAASMGVCADVGTQTVVGYSSQGPDRYADRTIVRDGECYALVCSKPGVQFGGFNMDGTLANPQNDNLAAVAPSAKDGRCRPVVFVLKDEYRNAHKDDTWSVYLLDTRRADGVPVGLKDGRLARVNCYSRPDAAIDFGIGAPGLKAASLPTAGLCADALAAVGQAPNPIVTGVAVKDGKLVVQVANTVEWVTYELAGGRELGAATPMAEEPKDGDAARPIELTTKADANAKFVRVVNRAGCFARKGSAAAKGGDGSTNP